MLNLDFCKPILMGVINLTPDSFSDGGLYQTTQDVFDQIQQMIDAGVDIIDIGAESSRPGSDRITADEEISRLYDVINSFKLHFNCLLSLDTTKAAVAKFGLEHGVDIMNDISALTFDNQMADVLKQYKPAVVLMHMKGTPKTMQQDISYDNVVSDVYQFLEERVSFCRSLGLESIIIDPGIGFGKRLEDNLSLLSSLGYFKQLQCPILVGTSRKSFISLLSESESDNRLAGTIASQLVAWQKGASVFRVHDVFEAKQAFDVCCAIEETVC